MAEEQRQAVDASHFGSPVQGRPAVLQGRASAWGLRVERQDGEKGINDQKEIDGLDPVAVADPAAAAEQLQCCWGGKLVRSLGPLVTEGICYIGKGCRK